jgi:excisionase family DNA binding protein
VIAAPTEATPLPADSAAEPDDAAKLQPFTVLELSKLMRCSDKTIYSQASAGKIPGVIRVGAKLLFARPVITAWLSGEPLPKAGKGGRR